MTGVIFLNEKGDLLVAHGNKLSVIKFENLEVHKYRKHYPVNPLVLDAFNKM